MTNDEIRLALQGALPVLRAELQSRKAGRAERPDAAEAWRTVADIVKRLAAQIIHASVAPFVDPDDVAQKVLLKLQAEAVLLRVIRSKYPLAYLRGLIRFALLDHLRTLQLADVSLSDIGEDSPRLSQPGSDVPGPEREVPAPSPSVVALRRVLWSLSESDRRLLGMRFWQDMSVAEIAAALKQPPSRISVRLFRLIGRLRRADMDSK